MEILTYIALALSVIGNILVNNQKKSGYVAWIISNLLWIIFAIYSNIPAQLIMFIIYTILSIHGFSKWKAIEKKDKPLNV